MKELAAIALTLLSFTPKLSAVTQWQIGNKTYTQSSPLPTPLLFAKICGDTSSSSGCTPSSSTTVFDSSPSAINGTWSGTPCGTSYYYSTGYVEPYAGCFDGSTTGILFNFSEGNGNPFAHSIWVYISSTSDKGAFWSMYDGSGGLTVGVGSGNLSTSGNNLIINFASGPVDTGVAIGTGWHNIQVKWDTTTTTAYIDCALAYSSTAHVNGFTSTTQIGYVPNGSAKLYVFTGLLNNFRAYSSLTTTQSNYICANNL